jgi:hypothetical protein
VATVDDLLGGAHADYFAGLSPASYFGLATGSAAASGPSAAGAGLPASTASVGDGVDKPWSPDSPLFWLGVIMAATAAGIVGASVNFRAGPARVGASIGKA